MCKFCGSYDFMIFLPRFLCKIRLETFPEVQFWVDATPYYTPIHIKVKSGQFDYYCYLWWLLCFKGELQSKSMYTKDLVQRASCLFSFFVLRFVIPLIFLNSDKEYRVTYEISDKNCSSFCILYLVQVGRLCGKFKSRWH